MTAWLEVLGVSAKLGLTSFGGPAAHLGYFHEEYINRRRWLDERSYADLVALCQFLPGPASSQVGIGIGMLRAGWLGGIAAWLGFTLPSVILLVLFALLMKGMNLAAAGWIHGLKMVAVAIVAQAVLSMGQKLAPDRARMTLVVLAAAAALFWQTPYSQVLIIAAAGGAGLWLYRHTADERPAAYSIRISRWAGACCLGIFLLLLVVLPLLRSSWASGSLALFDSMYRSGSLVFGGGHVVLPLLEREVVPTGWVSENDFLAGYGVTQAIPGPLFTFAAYLGAVFGGIQGTVVATIGIFLPAFLLVAGALPFWNSLRSSPRVQGALLGINAAVVGLLLAALYDPLWTTTVRGAGDFALAAGLFVLLVFWKLPPWLVVLAGAAGGLLL
ncbi:chromate efflux transporter [Paenibacillus sp. JX-17]|uniref:Chromate efflux transporter n=1 Tax=Paenibacillus lacisoli TaxID=3064525 RepID=A0ABT9CAL3_9BACL|nr:chromate efflux transporter [Paenibacillus sp. JX-17]MDO7906287.1 chromate efflux transporter [Paenibacillus sp. JX-17]